MDPAGALLDLIAAGVASDRWSFWVEREGTWETHLGETSAKDELLGTLAPTISIPTRTLLPADSLGDVGERLAATGVNELLAISAATEAGAIVAFFEDPSAQALEGMVDLDLAENLLRIARQAADAEGKGNALEVLRKWLPSLDELSRGELDDATGLELLGESIGATELMSLRQLRRGVAAASATKNKSGRWQQRTTELEIELSAGDALKNAANELKMKQSDALAIGRSPDETLLIATPGPNATGSLLDVCATILAFASERSADSSATRNNAMLQERARIASVMHEGITQVLTNVALQMEVLEQLLVDPEAARKMLKSLREAVLEALDSLRGAILELNPAAPEWTDLAGGLERFTSDFASQWGMQVRYELKGNARDVDPEVVAVVFGFVQEALTNVRKHAPASQTDVTLSFEDAAVVVTVSDDGPGFDTDAGAEAGFRLHQGLGLTRSRINLAGGRFTLQSVPDEGTTLKLEIGA